MKYCIDLSHILHAAVTLWFYPITTKKEKNITKKKYGTLEKSSWHFLLQNVTDLSTDKKIISFYFLSFWIEFHSQTFNTIFYHYFVYFLFISRKCIRFKKKD